MYTHIVHLADIHIVSNRYNEYINVFQETFKGIKDLTVTPLIVLAGDVIHNKNKLTAEVIHNTHYLLDNLSALGKTVVISGNHDLIEYNNERKKYLEVICKKHNVDYINVSNEYVYDNITLGISTLDDHKFISYTDLKHTDNLCVALMHCMLKEVGLPGYEQCVSDFNGYDFALLGDIHERKFYPPNCYYSGSLLQRDHGESMNKGFGLLEVSTKDYKFIDVPNDYGFFTIKADKDGNIKIPKLKPYSNIRIFRDVKHSGKDSEHLSLLNEHTTVIDFVAKEPKYKSKNIEEVEQLKNDNEILDQILKDNPNKDKLLELHNKYKKEGFVDYATSEDFELTKLGFENIFNYDTKQSIDFSDRNGLISIIGKNASGKSNILRIITFAICGDISVDYAVVDDEGKKKSADGVKYNYNNYYILHKSKDKGHTSIEFKYKGDNYKILRELKRGTTDKVVTTLKYYKNGKLNPGFNKKDTDLDIHKIFGRSSTFLLMNVYNRYTGTITTCTPKERFNAITNILNLSMYVGIYNKISDELKIQKKELVKCSGKMEQMIDNIDNKNVAEDINKVRIRIEFYEMDNNRLNKHYSSNIPMGKEITNINVNIEAFHKDREKYSKMVIEDFPTDGGKPRTSSVCWIKLLKEYNSLKDIPKPPNDIPNIGNLPLPCKTDISYEEYKKLDDKLKKYGYNELFDVHNLKYYIKKFGYAIETINSNTDKINVDVDVLDNLEGKEYKNVNVNLKSKLEKSIASFKPVDIQKLQSEIDNFNIAPLKEIAEKKDIKECKSLNEEIKQKFKSYFNGKYVENIDPLIDDISELVSEIYKIKKDIEYNKEIDNDIKYNNDILKKTKKKEKLIIKRDKALKSLEEYNENKSTLNKINHNLELNKLKPVFTELNRRLSYMELHKEVNQTYYAYTQNIAFLKEQKKKYERLQEIKPYMIYYNNLWIQNVKDITETLSNINYTVIQKIEHNKKKIEEYKQILANTSAYNAMKEVQDKYDVLNNEVSLKKEYQRLLGKDGSIQNYIVNHYLTSIENTINEELMALVDYKIKLELCNDTIKLYVLKNNLTLHPPQLSGYESFCLDVVSKYVLNIFSNTGTSTFFAIDEGLDCIDSDNISKFQIVLNKMKEKYTHILLISHMTEIQELSDNVINVKYNKID